MYICVTVCMNCVCEREWMSQHRHQRLQESYAVWKRSSVCYIDAFALYVEMCSLSGRHGYVSSESTSCIVISDAAAGGALRIHVCREEELLPHVPVEPGFV